MTRKLTHGGLRVSQTRADDTYISARHPRGTLAPRGVAVCRPFPFAGRTGVVFPRWNPYIFRMRKAAGFTLIELLVTMTVAAILVGLAGPSFKITIQNNRLVTQGNDLLGALIYARSQAIELNSTVTVCASSDGATCSGTNWASGWVVGYAPSGGSNPVATMLRSHAAITGGNTLNGYLSGGTATASLAYLNSGMLSGSTNTYFNICDSRGASYGRYLLVTGSGIARLSTTVGKQLDGTTAMSCP